MAHEDIHDMVALRARIDALDARLIALLAERSTLIDRAAQIKAQVGLPARIDARVEEVAAEIFLGDLLQQQADLLSHGQKQWLEIGMLLMQDPALLMLDEPVAGMSVNERVQTADLLRRISQGRSVLVIEHDMEFVKSIAHKVTVLHQGKVLAEGSMESVQSNPKVIEVYLGH